MITGCFLNFKTPEDPKGENSWLEFRLSEDRESLDLTVTLNGVKGEVFSLPKEQVGLFVDCFSKWTGRAND